MSDGLGQQHRAVASGYWPLIRYDPMAREAGSNPFLLDSPRPRIALTDYTQRELRYRSLTQSDPAEAERLGTSPRKRSTSGGTPTSRWPPTDPGTPRRRAQGTRLMDLTTTYMGLELRNPLVASASPLSNTLDGIRRLADAGVGAIVLYSLFEEQVRREAERDTRLAESGEDAFAESLSYFPPAPNGRTGRTRYLDLIERGVTAVVTIPVIASLNGSTPAAGPTTPPPSKAPAHAPSSSTIYLPPATRSPAAARSKTATSGYAGRGQSRRRTCRSR